MIQLCSQPLHVVSDIVDRPSDATQRRTFLSVLAKLREKGRVQHKVEHTLLYLLGAEKKGEAYRMLGLGQLQG